MKNKNMANQSGQTNPNKSTTSGLSPEQHNEGTAVLGEQKGAEITSDLGELLYDTVLEQTQNSDFRPVSGSDVEEFAPVGSGGEPIVEKHPEIDLTSIDLNNEIEEVAEEIAKNTPIESEQPEEHQETNLADLDLTKVDLPEEGEEETINSDIINEVAEKKEEATLPEIELETPVVEEPVAEPIIETTPIVEEIVEAPTEELSTEESITPEATEEPVVEETPVVEPIIEEVPVVEEIVEAPAEEVPAIEPITDETPEEEMNIEETPTEEIVAPETTEELATEEIIEENTPTIEPLPVEETPVVEPIVEEAPVVEEIVEAPAEEVPAIEPITEVSNTESQSNIENLVEQIEPVVEETSVVEPIIEEVPVVEESIETPAEEIPAIEPITDEAPEEEMNIEETPIVEPIIEEVPVIEETIETPTEELPVEETESIIAPAFPTMQEPFTPVEMGTVPESTEMTQNTEPTNLNMETEPTGFDIDNLIGNIEEAVAEVQENPEGAIPLDPTTGAPIPENTEQVDPNIQGGAAIVPPVTQTRPAAKQKGPIKVVLALLGFIALAGFLYFGYITFLAPKDSTPTSTTTTGDQQSGENIGGPELPETPEIPTTGGGEITYPEVPITGGTVEQPIEQPEEPVQTITIQSLMESATKLSSEARRVRIDAMIAKNSALATMLFDIQKEATAIAEDLANTTDMSILDTTHNKILSLQEQLSLIQQQLYANNSQAR